MIDELVIDIKSMGEFVEVVDVMIEIVYRVDEKIVDKLQVMMLLNFKYVELIEKIEFLIQKVIECFEFFREELLWCFEKFYIKEMKVFEY